MSALCLDKRSHPNVFFYFVLSGLNVPPPPPPHADVTLFSMPKNMSHLLSILISFCFHSHRDVYCQFLWVLSPCLHSYFISIYLEDISTFLIAKQRLVDVAPFSLV